MMVELHDKMKDEDNQLTSEEMDGKHSYQMLAQTLTDKIEKQTATRNRKASTKKKQERDSSGAAGELAEAKAAKGAEEKYLVDLRATCEQEHTDFESRQKLRAEELEALDKAIEIIAGGAVSGVADAHLPALAQISSKHTILAQLRASTTLEEAQSAAATYLKLQRQRMHSSVLLAISSRVSKGAFKKIMKMIKDMIMKVFRRPGCLLIDFIEFSFLIVLVVSCLKLILFGLSSNYMETFSKISSSAVRVDANVFWLHSVFCLIATFFNRVS